MSKVKDCPFCQSDELIVESSEGEYWVKCEQCGAQGPVEHDRKTAVKNWNLRG